LARNGEVVTDLSAWQSKGIAAHGGLSPFFKSIGRVQMEVVCNTVGELIEALSKLPPETVPIGIDPPFDGIKLVVQHNGKVLLCRPRTPESLSRKKVAA
jgi:hypothetical protein